MKDEEVEALSQGTKIQKAQKMNGVGDPKTWYRKLDGGGSGMFLHF